MQGVQQNSNQLLKFTLRFSNCFCAYFLLLSAPSPYNKNEKTQALAYGILYQPEMSMKMKFKNRGAVLVRLLSGPFPLLGITPGDRGR